MTSLPEIEENRLELQARLDVAKTGEARNQMGQFATPTALARDILKHGVNLLGGKEPIRFFDPAIGTGSFYSALLSVADQSSIGNALGYEIDPHYGIPAGEIWGEHDLEIRLKDFVKAEPGSEDISNLIICNPPYVRHHHIDADVKSDIQLRTQAACGVEINGLSGLYCYFMGLSHKWMLPGAIAGWLVPSEFLGVNYGRRLKQYLMTKVTLLQVHRFDPENVQFDDALVSSAVVWFRNTAPSDDHEVTFSYGGTLSRPEMTRQIQLSELSPDAKWTRYPQNAVEKTSAKTTLGDLFDIKRGLATGDNKFFIMDEERIRSLGLPMECFCPVLPGSRYLPNDEILADNEGLPVIEKRLFLLNTQLSEEEIEDKYPALKSYLDGGKLGEKPVSARYLCRSRRPWYSQENRPPAPIVCTYMGRSRNGAKPFRFILNHSNATACNVYLMLYPKGRFAEGVKQRPDILKGVWEFLNKVDPAQLLGHGRVYGGGLHKLEPKELRGFPADDLLAALPGIAPAQPQLALA